MRLANTAGLAVVLSAAWCLAADSQERDERRGREIRATLKSLDAAAGTLTVSESREREVSERTLNLIKNVKVTIDGRDTRLSDLVPGNLLLLQVSGESGDVLAIRAEGAAVTGVIRSVDPLARTITLGGDRERTLTLAPDAKVLLEGRPGELAGLREGMRVSLRLSSDQRSVVAIQVGEGRQEGEGRRPDGDRRETPLVGGVVKAVDAEARTITLAGEDRDQTFPVHREARINLAEIRPGTRVQLRLTADRSAVVALAGGEGERRDAPAVRGTVKAVDPAARKITLAHEGEEKTYTVHPEARVNLEEIKPGLGIVLWLTPDRSSVVRVAAVEGDRGRRPEGDREQAGAGRLAEPLFNLLDADRDGKVTPAELEAFFKKYDKDGDRVVTIEEFTGRRPERREER